MLRYGAGQCHDYLRVSSTSQPTTTYYVECGAAGKQVVDVPASTADVNFVAAETSSTQRGFFLYYEGNQSLECSSLDFLFNTFTDVSPFSTLKPRSHYMNWTELNCSSYTGLNCEKSRWNICVRNLQYFAAVCVAIQYEVGRYADPGLGSETTNAGSMSVQFSLCTVNEP